jgi:formiminotetrahydrofolate cyclodeaminase
MNNDIRGFLEELASSAPTPGGGGASSLAGAVGVALCSMVANLTTGKKKYAQYQQDIETILAQGDVLRGRLLELVDKDAEAFEPLAKAYSIPKDNPGRDVILEDALKAAAATPYAILETLSDCSDLVTELGTKGSRLAISDAGVGISMCNSAMEGASLNVYINTKLMKNTKEAKALELRADELREQASEIATKTFDYVLKEIRG